MNLKFLTITLLAAVPALATPLDRSASLDNLNTHENLDKTANLDLDRAATLDARAPKDGVCQSQEYRYPVCCVEDQNSPTKAKCKDSKEKSSLEALTTACEAKKAYAFCCGIPETQYDFPCRQADEVPHSSSLIDISV
ncbi:hypothetical protein BDW74DRAFT_175581 [Aspergillus multicolor]|uniref:uncharacterized protein n=1 Tax=Aspergillus multicolor TaxID=41759 RepID=UPI003CCDFD29